MCCIYICEVNKKNERKILFFGNSSETNEFYFVLFTINRLNNSVRSIFLNWEIVLRIFKYQPKSHPEIALVLKDKSTLVFYLMVHHFVINFVSNWNKVVRREAVGNSHAAVAVVTFQTLTLYSCAELISTKLEVSQTPGSK